MSKKNETEKQLYSTTIPHKRRAADQDGETCGGEAGITRTHARAAAPRFPGSHSFRAEYSWEVPLILDLSYYFFCKHIIPAC